MQPWRSLRVQLALLVFLAIYLPVLAMLAVSDVAESTVVIDGVEITDRVSTERSPWLTVTAAHTPDDVIALVQALDAGGATSV